MNGSTGSTHGGPIGGPKLDCKLGPKQSSLEPEIVAEMMSQSACAVPAPTNSTAGAATAAAAIPNAATSRFVLVLYAVFMIPSVAPPKPHRISGRVRELRRGFPASLLECAGFYASCTCECTVMARYYCVRMA